MSSGSPFLFGPLGYMQQIELDPGVTRSTERGRGEFVTSGGVRYVQKARHAPRAWEGGMALQSSRAMRLLTAAAQGVVRDCWLYDVAGARANMVPPHLTAGSGSLVSVGGVPLGALPAGTVVSVPVLAGRSYAVSAWSDQVAGGPVFTCRLGSGATVSAVAPVGSGPRPASHAVTPMADSVLTVTIGAGVPVSGLRVHEGFPDGEWLPGHGTPCRVDVVDPEVVLQLVADGHGLSDYTVSLQEVGIPGVI